MLKKEEWGRREFKGNKQRRTPYPAQLTALLSISPFAPFFFALNGNYRMKENEVMGTSHFEDGDDETGTEALDYDFQEEPGWDEFWKKKIDF